MNCKEFEDKIAAFAEGLLDPILMSKMDEHRSNCPVCARFAEAYNLILMSLNSTEPVKSPKGLTERILASIESPAVESVYVPASVKPIHKYWAIAAAVAAVGSLAAAMISLSGIIYKSIPELTGGIINTAPVLSRITMVFQRMHSLIAELQINEQLQHGLKLLTEPLNVPYLSHPVPIYYVAALAVVAFSAWSYFGSPAITDAAALSE